jgi:hypothetical protein
MLLSKSPTAQRSCVRCGALGIEDPRRGRRRVTIACVLVIWCQQMLAQRQGKDVGGG